MVAVRGEDTSRRAPVYGLVADGATGLTVNGAATDASDNVYAG